jgi:ubiquinone/menaquinone biosynthesis C-methylase UbiE
MKIVSCLLIAALPLAAQVAEKANENYKTKEGRAGVASTLSSAGRDERQKPKELVAALELKPGMVVADIGTGAGYMLPYLSEAVGTSGKIFAEDIYPDFVETAKKKAGSLKNVEFVLGNEKATNLPPASVDVLFALDAYHHFNYPRDLLADFKLVLKNDGRLIIVEYHKNKESMANGRALEHIRVGVDDAIKEIESAGWKLVSRKDFIPRVQWMAVFQKP